MQTLAMTRLTRWSSRRADARRGGPRRPGQLPAVTRAPIDRTTFADPRTTDDRDGLRDALAVRRRLAVDEFDRAARALHRAVRRLQGTHDFQSERAAGTRFPTGAYGMCEIGQLQDRKSVV